MLSDIFIYATPGDDNIIYHTIIDPITKKACYPDILIKHDFKEQAIKDSKLYKIAEDAIKEYGSSRCYFITYKDEELYNKLTKRIRSIYEPTLGSGDNLALIEDLAVSLKLSETMTNSLKTLLTYYGNFVGDLKDFTDKCREEYSLPVTNKNQGKKIYEQIRQQILCQ